MFEGIKNIGQLIKLAGQAKEHAARLQAELERCSVIGEAGAGAVRVTLNGKGRALRVEIDQPLMTGIAGDDKAMAEELIAAAFNNGAEKVQQLVMEKTREMTGGMDLPGLEQITDQNNP
jgi:hypothetical protein